MSSKLGQAARNFGHERNVFLRTPYPNKRLFVITLTADSGPVRGHETDTTPCWRKRANRKNMHAPLKGYDTYSTKIQSWYYCCVFGATVCCCTRQSTILRRSAHTSLQRQVRYARHRTQYLLHADQVCSCSTGHAVSLCFCVWVSVVSLSAPACF